MKQSSVHNAAGQLKQVSRLRFHKGFPPMTHRSHFRIALVLFFSLSIAVRFCSGQANQVVELKLRPGKTIERAMAGRETHRYQVDLAAAEFFQVRVEQKGIDVMLTLLDANGDALVKMDSPNSKQGPETLSFVAAKAGRYALAVSAFDGKAEKGFYTISRRISRRATALDQRRVDVERLFVDGMAANALTDQKEAALKKLEESLAGWDELQDNYMREITAETIGTAYKGLKENEKAERYFKQQRDAHREGRIAHATVLTRGGAVQREITAGESDFYHVTMKARDFLRVHAEQQLGTDIFLTLTSPNHKTAIRGNATDHGGEPLLWIAEEAGVYLLEVGSLNKGGHVGRYRLQMRNLNPATPMDRKRLEAQTLFQKALGLTVSGLEFLPAFENVVSLWKEAEDLEYKRLTLDIVGSHYSYFGDVQKALAYFTDALGLHHANKDIASEAWTQAEICAVHNKLGKPRLALNSCNESLRLIQTQTKDAVGVKADALANLAEAYRNLGDYRLALNNYRSAIQTYSAIGDRMSLSNLAFEFAFTYSLLGDLQPGKEAWSSLKLDPAQSAMPNDDLPTPKIKFTHQFLSLFFGQAFWTLVFKTAETDKDLQERLKSLEFSERQQGEILASSVLIAAMGMSSIASRGLYLVASIKGQQGDMQTALSFYDQALRLAAKTNVPRYQALMYISIALTQEKLGEQLKASDAYQNALRLYRNAEDPEGIGTACAGLMKRLAASNNTGLAVLYGKQAINSFQMIRNNITNLEKEMQRAFLSSKESNYRFLAGLLISQGRLPEAQSVLDLLKEEEFGALVRRGGVGDATVPYSKAEAKAIEIINNLAVIGREHSVLIDRNDKGALDEAGKARLKQLEVDLRIAQDEYQKSLVDLQTEKIDSKTFSAIDAEAQTFMEDLRELGAGTVALYTVIVRDENGKTKNGWVILTTPDFRKAYPIDVTNLDEAVFAFRAAVSNPAYDPAPHAQQIYRMLFLQTSDSQKTTLGADLDTYLKDKPNKTLMWSLDGVLRYVPIGALNDGKQYLVERYRNVVFNTASKSKLKDAVKTKWTALGLGVSEERKEAGLTFPALPGSENELRRIIRDKDSPTGILPGIVKKNRDFTLEAMRDGLLFNNNAVVHISSHFRFQTADFNKSFLLLGQGHWSVEEMQKETNLFRKADLVTLSACDTAMGAANGKESEGFAYLAQALGAKAVIASLWPVDDVGTQVMMPEFYRLHETGLSKSAALQRAQLALLEGNTKELPTGIKKRSERVDQDADKLKLTPFKKDPTKPFAHPYYWAPFILIGNWK